MNDFALIVGIDHYQDAGMHHLRGAVNDAVDFHQWIADPNGGNVKDEHRILLTSEEGLDRVMMKQVYQAFGTLFSKAMKDRDSSRRFYFYFSGHGFGKDLNSAVLIPTDWANILGNWAIPSADFHNSIREKGVFKETFFFLDCCRTEKPNLTGMGSPVYVSTPNSRAKNSHAFTAFATKFSEVSKEQKDVERRNGYFTKALLEGLWGEASSEDGVITIDGLRGHLMKRTVELSRKGDWEQSPRFISTFEPDTVLVRTEMKKNVFSVVIDLETLPVGKFKLINGDNEEIGEYEHTMGSISLDLKDGLYAFVSLKDEQEMHYFNIRKIEEEQHVRF